MKFKDMNQKKLSNTKLPSQVLEIYNEKVCASQKYFCPKVWLKIKELKDEDVKEEYLAYLGFLEKTKTLTINLYAEYVNLFDQNNGLFRINRCYSINELNQCDFISRPFNSFLEFINSHIQNCIKLRTSEEFSRYLESFYSYYDIFIKENFDFLGINDLKQLEMRIKDKSKIYLFENIDFQIEKKFLEYIATIESVNFMMIERLDFITEDFGRYEVEKTISDGLQMLASKVSRLQKIYFVKNDKSIEHLNKSYDTGEMDLSDEDGFDIDYYEHPSYLYVDNFFDIKKDEQKFDQETSILLKNISSYDLTINNTDPFLNKTYINVFSTEADGFTTINSTAPN
ncbi:hypothetical protein NBO_395g0007 [Nosema bombycis CQ1]|uniref:Uncharacterized protein n=1 Tax=Nosema bombycis (strain CQ1 / CVCC 102059) TaxID=578461 RepID=R0M3M6_NOSB1|nr:hypothetical protein NBO_395g0007 [Nosema bombycis CQ1]|eukprot:EOB12624.1 hypothetical protein NBO_395g0007 [Nosema bombycis CQ1]